MDRRRGCRRVAYGALIVLIAQSWLAPLTMAITAANLNAVVICTSTGFKVLALADEFGLPPEGSDETPGHDAETTLNCAACLIQAVGKILPPLQTMQVSPAFRPVLLATPTSDAPRHHSHHGVPNSRAPPAA